MTTPDNRYFYLYHSYHATDFEYIGRQGLLDELVWDETTGWPRFKNGNTPSVIAGMPFPNTHQVRDSLYSDNFSNGKNRLLWQWDLKNPKPEIRIRKGLFTLSTNPDGLVFTGIPPKTGNYSFEAELAGKSALSGIGIYGNAKNLLAFMAGPSNIILYQIKKGTKEILAEIPVPGKASVSLKLNARHGRYYHFFYTTDQKNWIPVKIENDEPVDGHFLPQWGVAMRTGLMVEGKQGDSGAFTSVKMSYNYSE